MFTIKAAAGAARDAQPVGVTAAVIVMLLRRHQLSLTRKAPGVRDKRIEAATEEGRVSNQHAAFRSGPGVSGSQRLLPGDSERQLRVSVAEAHPAWTDYVGPAEDQGI
ncbi:hypothetical protein NDU88_002191 [Pleurodeles waltl]|uniref:Uncharacterized protein n=1 Tax=Pleurodeles waltl TaxID=8319 RepID=A0AAV7MN47_PLEWA|nr:hypothetical protein NDU88_002191 [Pleurodeles waltl]